MTHRDTISARIGYVQRHRTSEFESITLADGTGVRRAVNIDCNSSICIVSFISPFVRTHHVRQVTGKKPYGDLVVGGVVNSSEIF